MQGGTFLVAPFPNLADVVVNYDFNFNLPQRSYSHLPAAVSRGRLLVAASFRGASQRDERRALYAQLSVKRRR